MIAAQPGKRVGVLEGDGAQHHPGGAGTQQLLHVGRRAQPPAGLDGAFGRAYNLDQQAAVLGLAGAGAVEIDDVEPGGPRSTEGGSHLGGVLGVDGLAAEATLEQSHAAAPGDVDRRVDREAHAATQRPSRASPAAELFSGWNWTASRGPRSIRATTRPPWSHVPVTSASSEGCTA